MKLNLGCGNNYKTGWINTDINKQVKAEYYFDLGKDKFPFKDNSFNLIEAKMVFEHLKNYNERLFFLKEIYRIGNNNCKINLSVPHFSSITAYSDIQHVAGFSSKSLDYFSIHDSNYYGEGLGLFEIKSKIIFNHIWRILGFNKIINRSVWLKKIYEIYFPFIFTADEVRFELIIIK